MTHTLFRTFTIAMALFILNACSPRIDYRGKSPEEKSLAKLKVGTHTYHDVLSIIGSPTFESSHGQKTWFYIHKKTEQTAFFTPDIIDKNTIAITFNAKGVIQKIQDMDPKMQNIQPLEHSTPTVGSSQTVLQQVFSNFGRTARKSSKK